MVKRWRFRSPTSSVFCHCCAKNSLCMSTCLDERALLSLSKVLFTGVQCCATLNYFFVQHTCVGWVGVWGHVYWWLPLTALFPCLQSYILKGGQLGSLASEEHCWWLLKMAWGQASWKRRGCSQSGLPHWWPSELIHPSGSSVDPGLIHLQSDAHISHSLLHDCGAQKSLAHQWKMLDTTLITVFYRFPRSISHRIKAAHHSVKATT